MSKAGRPQAFIDPEQVQKLCSIHCTGEEIAGFFGVHYETLNNHVKTWLKEDGSTYKNFSEYFAIHSSRGKISLRKLQWNSATKGNIPMQIFLGKNYLNQTEKQQIDVPGDTKIKVTLDDVK